MPISRLCHHLYTEPAFIFTAVTTGAAETFTLPLEASGTYNFNVVWGDGNVDNITAYDAAAVTHTYASAGTYTVIITGVITGWRYAYGGDRTKIYDIIEWGPLRLGDNTRYFCGCSNLTVSALDNLNLTGTTTLDRAFQLCLSLTTIPSLNKWDLSGVDDLWSMFSQSPLFDEALNDWDVSNVVNGMYGVFYYCAAFNHDVSGWDVSSCTITDSMFSGATIFNQDITGWDVSSVTNMGDMFWGASAFNQPIGIWDVSAVTHIGGMFAHATSFDQDLSSWDMSHVVKISFMFAGANSFNRPIGGWNVAAVLDMRGVFEDNTIFNQPLNSWNTAIVTDMQDMFCGATAFNQPLSSWNTASVTTMRLMFFGATAFNQDITGWNVAAVTNMGYMFKGATAFDQNLGGWNITSVSAMDQMFNGVTLSTANYDAILIGWEGQAVSNNVTFDGGNSKYSAGAAATARAALIDDHSWNITDGGQV